jgi:hypothetical protein
MHYKSPERSPPIAFRPAAVILIRTTLDRFAAGHHHLALYSGKLGVDEPRQHAAAEAVAAHEQLSVDAVPIAGEQLKRATALRAEAR